MANKRNLPQLPVLPADANVSLPQAGNPLNVPQSQPQAVNPFDVYKNLGIKVNQNMQPATLADLQAGMQHGLNFGNPQLGAVYNNPLYNQNAFIQGIQNKQNYGNSFLANAENQQGFMPQQPQTTGQPQAMMLNQQQEQPQQGFMDRFKAHPFQMIEQGLASPVGRGLLTAGIVGATGGNGLQTLGYGAQTAGNNMRLKQEDARNRGLLKQYGVDTSNMGGYLSNEQAKNYIENYSKFDTLNTRKEALRVREALAGAKDKQSQRKIIFDAVNNGIMKPDEAKAQLELLGISTNLQESNKTNSTKADVALKGAKTTGQKIHNKNIDALDKAGVYQKTASGNLSNTKSAYIPKEVDIKQQNATSNRIRALKTGSGKAKTLSAKDQLLQKQKQSEYDKLNNDVYSITHSKHKMFGAFGPSIPNDDSDFAYKALGYKDKATAITSLKKLKNQGYKSSNSKKQSNKKLIY